MYLLFPGIIENQRGTLLHVSKPNNSTPPDFLEYLGLAAPSNEVGGMAVDS